MNRNLPHAPALNARSYSHRTAPWLARCFRLFLGSWGTALAVLTALNWPVMPTSARLLAVILVPGLVWGATWPRLWARSVSFIADEDGMYFPRNAWQVTSLGQQAPEAWLYVPWNHVQNVRLAKESGENTRCIAVDVCISAIEKVDFFNSVATPQDAATARVGYTAVAFTDWQPSLREVAMRLQHLQGRSLA